MIVRLRKLLCVIFVCAATMSLSSAADQIHQIDISSCESSPCYSKWVQTFTPETNVDVRAWFDVVDPFKEGYQSIYPLFNLFNRTGKDITIQLGMQLIGADGKVIVEILDESSFAPYSEKKSEYQTYRSLRPARLSSADIKRAGQVRVIYSRLPPSTAEPVSRPRKRMK